MPPNRFESEVGNFLEGSHGDRTHIKRANHHTVTPLCGTLLCSYVRVLQICCVKLLSPLLARARTGLKPRSPVRAGELGQLKPRSPLRVRNGCFWSVFRLQRRCWFQRLLFRGEQW